MRKIRSEQERCRESVPSLLLWYAYNARVLPWREDPDPYHVWISEIMLQQTRVEAVRGYYARFLEELPTVRDVAAATDDRLVKLWEGLGYYSRVRNIAKAAKELCERYDGTLPADYALLRSLPGIGEYTAGAIASIAFGLPVPAVDGNVLRVYARLLGSREDIRSDKFKKRIRGLLSTAMEEAFAGEKGPFPEGTEEIGDGAKGLCAGVEEKASAGTKECCAGAAEETNDGAKELCAGVTGGAGQFNQAIMDIGATVCIPNGRPHCDVCPLSHLCVAFTEDLTAEIPVKAEKKARPTERKTVLVICSGDRVLLHRRPKKGLLAGMWEFPNVPGALTPAAAKKAAAEVLRSAQNPSEEELQPTGAEISEGKPLQAKACEQELLPTEAEISKGKTLPAKANEPRTIKTLALRAHRLDDYRHVFSHVEWEMRGYRIDAVNASPDAELSERSPAGRSAGAAEAQADLTGDVGAVKAEADRAGDVGAAKAEADRAVDVRAVKAGANRAGDVGAVKAGADRDDEYVWATDVELRELYGLPSAFRFYMA